MNTQQQLQPGSAVRRALQQRAAASDRQTLWQQRLNDFVAGRPEQAGPRKTTTDPQKR